MQGNLSIRIKRGNTWNPSITFTQNDDPFDCTDYESKLVIKEELDSTAAVIADIPISWTTRDEGIGSFLLTAVISRGLNIGIYYFDINLYKGDESFVQTLIQGRLHITEALDTTMLT